MFHLNVWLVASDQNYCKFNNRLVNNRRIVKLITDSEIHFLPNIR